MVPLEAQKEVTPDATETTPESLKVAITLGTGSSFCPEPRGNATQGWGCGDGAKNIPSIPSTSLSSRDTSAALLEKPSLVKKSVGDEQSRI